jgi:hypothetical protein
MSCQVDDRLVVLMLACPARPSGPAPASVQAAAAATHELPAAKLSLVSKLCLSLCQQCSQLP